MNLFLIIVITFQSIIFSISTKNENDLNIRTISANFVENINSMLKDNNSSIEIELSKLIVKYENLANQEKIDEFEYEKIIDLKNTTIDLLNLYESYGKKLETKDYSETDINVTIAGALAYFNSKGYDLAAELLTHARDNVNIDSIYTPVLYEDVMNSTIFSSIYNNSIFEGSSNFPKAGSVDDIDLYYSIHSFNYYKSKSRRVIELRDRYDFVFNSDLNFNDFSTGVTNILYYAQIYGIINPYYVDIVKKYDDLTIKNETENVYIRMPYDEYYEDLVVLGTVEYKDYSLTFDNPGYKIIQTIGNKDTKIELYDSYSNLLASDDDDGYSLNSLINYTFEASKRYVLRVRYYGGVTAGVTKLTIIPAYDMKKNNVTTIQQYENIYNVSQLNNSISVPCYDGYSTLLTFTPSSNNDYTIKTIGSTDTYMYLIDPRCPDLITNYDYDDDSGDGTNALINKRLASSIIYLIVCARPTIHDDYQTTNIVIS